MALSFDRRNFLNGVMATVAVAALGSKRVTTDEEKTKKSEHRRILFGEVFQPTSPPSQDLRTIKLWANSKNGILRSIASYYDPFTQAFNIKNPAWKPLTFEGVNYAFVSKFKQPVKKLIKINDDLLNFYQSNPHFAYLSGPVQWNSNGATRQLFRFKTRSLESVNEDTEKIRTNNFSPEEGGRLPESDQRIALRVLESIKSPYWDVGSPYSDANLTLREDDALKKLEYNLVFAQEPEKIQRRTIYFQDREDQETPSKIPEGAIKLKPNQYQDIRKAKP